MLYACRKLGSLDILPDRLHTLAAKCSLPWWTIFISLYTPETISWNKPLFPLAFFFQAILAQQQKTKYFLFQIPCKLHHTSYLSHDDVNTHIIKCLYFLPNNDSLAYSRISLPQTCSSNSVFSCTLFSYCKTVWEFSPNIHEHAKALTI